MYTHKQPIKRWLHYNTAHLVGVARLVCFNLFFVITFHILKQNAIFLISNTKHANFIELCCGARQTIDKLIHTQYTTTNSYGSTRKSRSSHNENELPVKCTYQTVMQSMTKFNEYYYDVILLHMLILVPKHSSWHCWLCRDVSVHFTTTLIQSHRHNRIPVMHH